MSKKPQRQRNAGAVLMIVMGCLAIASALIVGWARLAMLETRQVRATENRLQAEWLAESGLQRAAARLLVDSEYRGETWQVSAAELGRQAASSQPAGSEPNGGDAFSPGPAVGVVVIKVEPVSDRATARKVHVRADFPASAEGESVEAESGGGSPAKARGGIATNRISKQLVFDLAGPAAHQPPGDNEPQSTEKQERP